MAVEEYKNSNPQKMAAKAQQIYNDFVAVKATKQVRYINNRMINSIWLILIDFLFVGCCVE